MMNGLLILNCDRNWNGRRQRGAEEAMATLWIFIHNTDKVGMLEVVADRNVWRLNLELLSPQLSRT